MNTVIGLFVELTLLTTMVALGLGLRSDAVIGWLRRPGLPLRLLLVSCVLVPLLALLLLKSPWNGLLSKPAGYAIALMALCPSAPMAMHKARKLGGDHQLAAVVQVGAALTAIVTVPLLGLAFRQSFAVMGWQMSPLEVAGQVARVQVLPVLLGLGIRHWRPQLASTLEGPLTRLANVLLLVLFSLVLAKAGPLLLPLVPANLPAVLLMALLALAALLMGQAMAGGEPEQRLSAGLVTAMRNPGLALLFANRNGSDLAGLKLLILLYVLVTVVVSLPWTRRQHEAPPSIRWSRRPPGRPH